MQVWKSKVQNGKMCTGGKYKYRIFKYSYERMEKASTENSSTGEQGWKMQVQKNRVRNNNAVILEIRLK